MKASEIRFDSIHLIVKVSLMIWLILGLANAGFGQGQTFTAANNGAWSNPNTWDPAGVPGDRDVVIINVSNRQVTLDITTAVEGFFLSSGSLDGDETLTITEEFSWTGGALEGASESEDLNIIIPETASAIFSGGSKRLDASITNEGAIAWNDGNITSSTAGLGLIDNKGEFVINGSSTASFIRFYNDSGGIVNKSSGGAARFSAGQFSNDGEVDVREGTLELFGNTLIEDPKDNGTYLVGPGTVLNFGSANRTLTETSTLDVNGELVVSSGSVEFLGTFNVAQYRQTGGTALLETGNLVDMPQLTMGGGTLGGSDEMNLTGDALWQSGTFANGGIIIPDGTTLSINLTTTSQLNTSITNNGTLNWISGRITSSTALLGTIFNNSDFIIRTDNDLTFIDIRNSGVITKESGSGVTFFNSGFFQNEASGLVQINSGTLRISQSTSVSEPAADRGIYSAASGTVLHLSSNRSFAPDSEITADEVRINFGNITFEGLLDIQTLNQSGNTINTVFDRGRSVTIPNLVLDGGTLTPDDALNISSQFEWIRGNVAGSEEITVLEGGNFIITGTGSRNLNGTIFSRGSASWNSGDINSSFTGGGTLINQGTFEINSANTFQRALFINEEEVRKSSSGLTSFSINTLENNGTFLLSDGSVRLNTCSSLQTPIDEGTWILENGTTLIVDGAERQLARFGSIMGSGIVEASASSLIDNRGIHSPGNSTGVLTYNGDFSMDLGSAEVIITLAGTTPGIGHDQLAVSGQAIFMGTLTVLLDDGYTPSNGDQFEVITYGRHSGEFDTVELPSLNGGLQFDLQYNDEELLLIVIDDSPNQPPVFTNTFDEETITEGDEFFFQFEADNPDGDELIFSLTQRNDVDNASITTGGLFTFNPETGQAGSYDFTVRVSDDDLFDEHDFVVTVVAVNQPPVFTSEPITIAQVDQLYQYDVETIDPDGDPVTVSAVTLPGWLSFTADDGGTGLLEGTPADSDIGDHEVVLHASDGEETTTQEFTIEVREELNEPPVFSTTFDEETIAEGDEFSFQFEAVDPDGDDLTFTLTQGNDVDNASITTGGLFSFNPNFGQVGDYDFTVRVSDGELFDEHDFSVTVITDGEFDPPVAENLDEVTWMNLAVVIDLDDVVSHPQNRPVSVVEMESPTVQGGTVEILEDLIVRYTPADGFTGQDSFTYTVRDDLNSEASAEVTINVNAILFELTDLGDLGGGASVAQALNDHGVVTGTSLNSSNEIKAFIWSDGELTEPQIEEAAELQAYAINNSGAIAGYAGLTETEGNAYRFAEGETAFTEAADGIYSSAYAINSAGVIAGVMESGSQYNGFAWNEEIIAINLPEGVLSIVYDLSDQNEAVGLVQDESGITRAFRNDELGPEGSRVYSMNSTGLAVGSSNNQPMIWPAGGEAEVLDGTGEIYSVNASGWKTGVVVNEMAKSASGYSHFGIRFYEQNPHLSLRRSAARNITGNSRSAALWVGRTLNHLNSLVQDAEGWQLIEAGAVNESGLIAGTARVNGQLRAFLLTPVENDGFPDVLKESFEIPGEESIYLHQNYPNPFNPTTTIRFELAEPGMVTLSVYDLLGRKVAGLVEGTMENGTHLVQFDASSLSSGVYFYQLHTDYGVRVRKLTLLK